MARTNFFAGFQSPRQVNDDNDSEDGNNTITPVQRRVPAVPSFNTPSPEDSSLVVRGMSDIGEMLVE